MSLLAPAGGGPPPGYRRRTMKSIPIAALDVQEREGNRR
jgi:hypothetical protein